VIRKQKQRQDLVSNNKNFSYESDSDPKRKDNYNSSYNSDSSDTRAECLKQRHNHYKAAGPALSDLNNKTKALIAAEKRE
jgi:hypothetical protein